MNQQNITKATVPEWIEIPEQEDVITLVEAWERTSNWWETVAALYPEAYEPYIPKAVFIPFEDIAEIEKLKESVTELFVPGTIDTFKIFIVGVRAYFTMNDTLDGTPPNNNPVDAILVAVYQTNLDGRDTPETKYSYNCRYPTYDLLLEVRKKQTINITCPVQKPPFKSKSDIFESPYFTIYDVTQPCPQLCDAGSLLNSF